MKNYLLMWPIKLMGIMGSIVVGTSLLTGCANMLHRLGYMPIQQSPSACATAPVLMTNLKEKADQRRYQLPDGHICSEINDYEQAQL